MERDRNRLNPSVKAVLKATEKALKFATKPICERSGSRKAISVERMSL